MCHQQGKSVDTATVKTLINISLHAIRDVPYFFCRTADCQVVYFSQDGQQTISKEQVRERVYQKEPNATDVMICYCFRHTPQSIQAEIETQGTSTVIEDINAGIHAGQCACDWRNPQGDCCLGNVHKFLKEIGYKTKSTH